MICPDKFTTLDNSIVSKAGHLLLDDRTDITISKLLELKRSKFSDIGEFILALDTLFALGKIEIDNENEIIKYVS